MEGLEAPDKMSLKGFKSSLPISPSAASSEPTPQLATVRPQPAPYDGDEELCLGNYLLAMPPPTTTTSRLAAQAALSTTANTSEAGDFSQSVLNASEMSSSNETTKLLVQFFSQHPMLKSFVAGSISGTCSTLLFQPFDLVKTRIQNANFAFSAPTTADSVAAGSSRVASTRIAGILVDVIKNEQVFGLWRGTVPSLMRCVPGVGLHFCCLDTLQSHFCAGRPPKAVEALAFGMASRSLAGIFLIPVTVVKTRYESGVFLYKSLTDAIRHTYRSEGVRGLTSGLLPTLARDVPFSGLYYMFYTQLKAQALPLLLQSSTTTNAPKKSSSSSMLSTSMVTFACGINAGLLASAVTQPMDVVKTHMQLYPKQFPSSFTTAVFIVKSKGASGLFSGLVPRMMRRTLVASMAWTVYEQMMQTVGLK